MTKAKMPVIIRPLRPADQAEWRGLWTAYLDFYGTTVDEDVYTTTFQRLLGDAPQDFNALIAEIGGQPVGLTHFLFHRHAWKTANVCYLQDLFAAPAARGVGVGRALIKAVYDIADKADIATVYWLTQDDNATARRLSDRIATKTNFIKYQRVAA